MASSLLPQLKQDAGSGTAAAVGSGGGIAAEPDVLVRTRLQRLAGLLYSTVVLVVFMTVGPMLIVVNNDLINKKGFPYPLLICGIGITGSAVFANVMALLNLFPISSKAKEHTAGIHYLYRIVPIGFLQAVSLASGNCAYLYLGVGIIQMLKSLTPLVIVAALFYFKADTPPIGGIMGVALISIGAAAMFTGSTNMNVMGVIMMLTSSLAEASRLVLTQNVLSKLKFSVVEGQYFIAPAASMCLLLGALVFEVPAAIQNNALTKIYDNYDLFAKSLVLGICVNYVSYIAIRQVGSLALRVLSILRNIEVVAYSALFLKEPTSHRELAGYGLCVVGTLAYALFSMEKQITRGRRP